MSREPLETTIFLVDDDMAIQRSFSILLKEVGLPVHAFASAECFLEHYDPFQPGCLVLDVRIPGISGLELQRRLKEMGSAIPIVFITGHGDIPMAVQAMRDGAVDFLEKPFRDQVVLDAIQHAIDIDRRRRERQTEIDAFSNKLEQLTERQREILNFLMSGQTTKQVAFALGISRKTVDFHRTGILEIMECNSLLKLSYPWCLLNKPFDLCG